GRVAGLELHRSSLARARPSVSRPGRCSASEACLRGGLRKSFRHARRSAPQHGADKSGNAKMIGPDLHDPATWAEIAPYLDRALELEPDERERWLTDLTIEKPQVVKLLRQLLAERRALDAQGFLSGSAMAAASAAPMGPNTSDWHTGEVRRALELQAQ